MGTGTDVAPVLNQVEKRNSTLVIYFHFSLIYAR